MASTRIPSRSAGDYGVACICPMGVELAPVKAILDNVHPDIPTQREQNSYILGDVAGHNIVVAVLPEVGTNAAATVAVQLLNDFPSIRFGLLVGVGGGVPDDEDGEQDGDDIRLGDVVVSKPTDSFGGVVQYDLGKCTTDGRFERTGTLVQPPIVLRSKVEQLAADHRLQGSKIPLFVSMMFEKFPAMKKEYSHPGAEQDLLFKANYAHIGGRTCHGCSKQRLVKRDDRGHTHPKIHYGTIGSANTLVKDALLREKLRRENKIKCIEMEAAGLKNNFPCLVIRGICDYADSHKNKKWQPYAAAVAAAYMKELLSIIPSMEATGPPVAETPIHKQGLNLFEAPGIDDQFVSREKDLEQMRLHLLSDHQTARRRVVVLEGMGGIGKTQLAIAYAKRYRNLYSSVFWLNATSETTLKSSLRLIGERIALPESTNVDQIDDDRRLSKVLAWLSELDNTDWLLIFDNYDEPDQYRINQYYPYAAHGSIIITSRLPDEIPGQPFQLHIQPLDSIEDGLEILSRRSERDGVHQDEYARRLATRLDGLPLALATAGAFLNRRKNRWTFEQYLKEYEKRWEVDPRRPLQLGEYEDRTLYTTWDLSLTYLEKKDSTAAQLLKLLAYFDHQAVWYELLRAGVRKGTPRWLQRITRNYREFDSAMRVLVDFRFLEVQSVGQPYATMQTYSMHICIHDWITAKLNRTVDPRSYLFAYDCVAEFLPDESWNGTLKHPRYASLVPHAARLFHQKIDRPGQEILKYHGSGIDAIASLLKAQDHLSLAEQVYQRSLAKKEEILGPQHPLTLETLNSFGYHYAFHGKFDESERMLRRALAGKRKVFGPEHLSTLETINNLGVLYSRQGRFIEAGRKFQQALTGKEKVLPPEHVSTIHTISNLGMTYWELGKLDDAEYMLRWALAGYERIPRPEPEAAMTMVRNLDDLYQAQGKHDGEQLLERAQAEKARGVGSENTVAVNTMKDLGLLYYERGKLVEAERMLKRALAGTENLFGLNHNSTCATANNLGLVYFDQGKFDDAEQMFTQALAGYERNPPPEAHVVLTATYNLALVRQRQSRYEEAREMFEKAIIGRGKEFGHDHPQTQAVVRDLERMFRESNIGMEDRTAN